MKIKLMIATSDNNYAEHLSRTLSEKFADAFDVSVCSSVERLNDLLREMRFDVALLDSGFVKSVNVDVVRLPIMLWNESDNNSNVSVHLKKTHKYQRISTLAGEVLQTYAEIGATASGFNKSKANITAVWSPAGGTGKTTVALAYAAHKVSSSKQTVYLNLEHFSSTSTYFQETGKSLSKALEKLESNLPMFLMGIRQQDSGTGIFYFCGPENYDDMNILSSDDIETLVTASATEIDELVVDLSSKCDRQVQKVLELANVVLIVCDTSSTSYAKLKQFINQYNIFGQIRSKTVLVNNKGAVTSELNINKSVSLPLVRSSDPISVFKTLSSSSFSW